MKRMLKNLVPSKLKILIRNFLNRPNFRLKLISNYWYDFKIYRQWSAYDGKLDSKDNLKAFLTMNYHRIEKGLALRNTKVPFGLWFLDSLLSNLELYIRKYGTDEVAEVTVDTLVAYLDFNTVNNNPLPDLENKIRQIKKLMSSVDVNTNRGGVIKIKKDHVLEKSKIDFRSFCDIRYSVRDFTDQDVSIEMISKAVLIAQKTPSVCNRQSSKVYAYTSKEDCLKVLELQNGNRGFREQINKVLIVTSSLENFVSVGERNQSWIDGGMFAMSLIYALHSLGLGTCCLNWSVEKEVDIALHQVASIPSAERVIMMLAVGHLPSEFKVAMSARKKLEEVLTVI